MLKADTEFDPVVEILRLAYRRGLAIQREQERETKEAGNFDSDQKPAGSKDTVNSDSGSTSQQKI
jgi:hypothetical protein